MGRTLRLKNNDYWDASGILNVLDNSHKLKLSELIKRTAGLAGIRIKSVGTLMNDAQDNFDKLTTTGFYKIAKYGGTPDVGTFPSWGANSGIILCTEDNPDYCAQFCFDFAGEIFERHKTGTPRAWSTWRKIA